MNVSAKVMRVPELPRKPSSEPYRWLSEPRWHLWEGGFLLIARATGLVPLHDHHAIQIVIALEGEVSISSKSEDWQLTQGLIVRTDAPHAFNCNGALGAMLFVDPESSEGQWLQTSLEQDITIVAGARLKNATQGLSTFIEQASHPTAAGPLIRQCVHALNPGAPPKPKLDARLITVLNAIHNLDDLHLSLESAAQKAFLSPSRFAHLFKEQLGLPFSRYMLWRKLTRAMLSIASAKTISEAAHAADFADAAHLTRTFSRMFGMAPSALMRGNLAPIPSPFAPTTPISAAETFPRASTPNR